MEFDNKIIKSPSRWIEMKKPKVLILGPRLSSQGGVRTYVKTILDSRLVDEYTLLYLETGLNATDAHLFSRLHRISVDTIKLITTIITKNPNLVHINPSFAWKAFWRDSWYLLLSKCLGKKTIFCFHGGGSPKEFYLRNNQVLRLLTKRVLIHVDRILVLSQSAKKEIEEITQRKDVMVIPHGIDSTKFKPSGAFREDYGIREDTVVILFMGRFLREKGVYETLDAIPIVLERFKNILFVFAGDGPERCDMMKFCDENKFGGHVRFLGWLSEEAKINALTGSNIFIFPTLVYEGLPMVMLEAMAVGLPVIASRNEPLPEFLRDGKNGFLVNPKNPKDFAERITELAEDRKLRSVMGKNNQKDVGGRYGLGGFIDNMKNVYDEMMRHE